MCTEIIPMMVLTPAGNIVRYLLLIGLLLSCGDDPDDECVAKEVEKTAERALTSTDSNDDTLPHAEHCIDDLTTYAKVEQIGIDNTFHTLLKLACTCATKAKAITNTCIRACGDFPYENCGGKCVERGDTAARLCLDKAGLSR